MARGEVEQGRLSGRAASRSLAPLRRVLPFLRPYRGRIALAGLALIASSTATLVLPALARGLIDHDLSVDQAESLSHYYLLFVVAAAVLGLASATRFYFVTWLGERVVADIRKAVFDNVLVPDAGLLRSHAHRRSAVAADRRHHPDPDGGRLLGFGGAAQSGDADRRPWS